MLKVKPRKIVYDDGHIRRCIFRCPHCQVLLSPIRDHCQACGCEIEWGSYDRIERGDDLIDQTAVDDSREQGTD